MKSYRFNFKKIKFDKKIAAWVLLGFILGVIIFSTVFATINKKKFHDYDKEVLMNYADEGLSAEEYDLTEFTLVDKSILNKDAALSEEYTKDLTTPNSKNILFLGEDKESSLLDTIGIISIDKDNKKLTIIMLPRDMYVDYSQSVIDTLNAAGKSKVAGIYKLNAAHYIGALMEYEGKFKANSISFLAELIKEKFDISVDDYIKINLAGFRKIVNLFGGVNIYVPYDMNYEDPSQDLYIHLEKGQQHLDGIKSEGFVRFRQGYNEDGSRFDVDRKKNQLAFLNAFIKQHGTITNINKIPDLLKTLSNNIANSIGFGDMLASYIAIARDIVNDKYEIENKNIKGTEKMIKGISYTVVDEVWE